MIKLIWRVSLIVGLCSLQACAGSGAGPLGLGAVVGERNLAAAEPLFSKDEEKCLDRADQLLGLIYEPADDDIPEGGTKNSGRQKKLEAKCAKMAGMFRTAVGSGEAYGVRQRNEVIDALVATSNRKCGRYSALLKNADGAMNAGLSLSAIVTGGLGSIIGGVETAKALSGSSAILSGSRAALNETYLTNQTIHVLAAAFENARVAQRRQITNRQECSVDQYSLMRGIEDAFKYHSSCSIVTGLAETARAVERSGNPGMDTMRLQMASLLSLRRQADEFAKDGVPTPIAAPPSTMDVASFVDANTKLIEAETAVDSAKQDFDASVAALDKITHPAAGGSAPLVADVQQANEALKAATDKLNATTADRDGIAVVRNKAFDALKGSFATADVDVVEPETRICPFTKKAG